MTVIRVLLVDDHQMFAEAVARLLGREDDIDVIAVAGTVAESVELAGTTQPDVAVVDYHLPDGDGVDATLGIIAAHPAARVLLLTGGADERMVRAALDAGCSGVITKDKALHALAEAVRRTSVGEVSLDSSMLPRLGARRLGDDLTQRELEVLTRVAAGHGNQAIAQGMSLSLHTVRNHVQNVLTKLHAHSRLEAVAIARREGIIP